MDEASECGVVRAMGARSLNVGRVEPCAVREIKFRIAALQKNIVAHAKTSRRSRHLNACCGRMVRSALSPGAMRTRADPSSPRRQQGRAARPPRPPDQAGSHAMRLQQERRRHVRSLFSSLRLPVLPMPPSVRPLRRRNRSAVRAAVVDMLGSRYRETVRSVGLAGRDRIVEVFASEDTGSWAIVVANSAGVNCLVASGQHYEQVAAGPEGAPL